MSSPHDAARWRSRRRGGPGRKRLRRVAAIATLALLTAGCAGPSRTERDYRLKAANTAEAARSAVETARLGATLAARGRAPAAYLSVLLAQAEENASAAQQTFDSVQPPDGRADAVRRELDGLLADVTGVLAELRIAVRRGHLDRLAPIAEPLVALSDRLDEFERAHS